jgi:pimeloyl-ACP methyl ester carboxylesterase
MLVSRRLPWMRATAAVAAAVLPLAAAVLPLAAAGQAQAGQVPAAGPARPATVTVTVKRHPIRVGSVTIPPCASSPLAWCTRINVPYQYVGRDPGAAGTIKLGFQWYPATSGRAAGTILAVQGGPGFATTDYAGQYRTLFRPLLGRRNLLLVNLRGTGNSSAFTCRALQDWTQADSIEAYTADTGKCGRQLNHTRRLKGGGGYVQASDLYTTADAARDVALLLRRLQTGRIDLYGDSYGTYFSQVFTARYARSPSTTRGTGARSGPPGAPSRSPACAASPATPRRPARPGRGSSGWPASCELIRSPAGPGLPTAGSLPSGSASTS